VLVGPRFELVGRDAIVRGLASVARYRATFHAITQQLFEIRADEASGETYCLASHLFEREGAARKLDWGIRYQDRCRRVGGGWRFARRELIVDWEQEGPLGATRSG
jgi:hypothetical protein